MASPLTKKASQWPKFLEHPTTWSTLADEVELGNVKKIRVESDESQISVHAHDQPKVSEIRDHALEVLMQLSVLDLHAVRVVRTPHGDERQLHLKVRVMCGWRELVADVWVDTAAHVGLVQKGLFPDTCLKDSARPVNLKLANGQIMGGGSSEAERGLKFESMIEWLNRTKQCSRKNSMGPTFPVGKSLRAMILWSAIQPEHL